jgi:hypothetical protein
MVSDMKHDHFTYKQRIRAERHRLEQPTLKTHLRLGQAWGFDAKRGCHMQVGSN